MTPMKYCELNIKIPVAVIGSRYGISRSQIMTARLIVSWMRPYISRIISGGAVGADTRAKEIAGEFGLLFDGHLPDYDRYGSRAPLVRNGLIIDDCGMVIALWDGESRGTYHALSLARRSGKPVVVISNDGAVYCD